MSLPHRGDVVSFRGSQHAKGHEQQGRRYAAVVQSDAFSELGTVLIVPTSTSAQPAIFRPEVTVQGRRTRLLADQLIAVDRSRIGRSVGRLSGPELEDLELSISRLLGLF
jgi:mRNA interferase MazF